MLGLYGSTLMYCCTLVLCVAPEKETLELLVVFAGTRLAKAQVTERPQPCLLSLLVRGETGLVDGYPASLTLFIYFLAGMHDGTSMS